MIKRLIFDVDGTLIAGDKFFSSVDGVTIASNAIKGALEEVLKKLNIYSEEKIDGFFSAIDEYEKEYQNYNKKDFLSYFSEFFEIKLDESFLDLLFDKLQYCIPAENKELYNKIEELSKKYELVLLTNYFKKSQMDRLNNMGIGKFFNECYGEKLLKPHPNSYIIACGTNEPNECIMIGDDLRLDIEGSKKSGLNAIWVNSKNLEPREDTVMVHKVEEITEEIINKAESINGKNKMQMV